LKEPLKKGNYTLGFNCKELFELHSAEVKLLNIEFHKKLILESEINKIIDSVVHLEPNKDPIKTG